MFSLLLKCPKFIFDSKYHRIIRLLMGVMKKRGKEIGVLILVMRFQGKCASRTLCKDVIRSKFEIRRNMFHTLLFLKENVVFQPLWQVLSKSCLIISLLNANMRVRFEILSC